MASSSAPPPTTQMPMPGMPAPTLLHPRADSGSMSPGQEVLYLGTIRGGPRYGSRGIVIRVLQHRAVVDLGQSSTWHIPYYLLTVPQAA